MKKTVVYIVGLSHSGSTFLDFFLSHHKDILGLGEVYSILINKKSNFEKTESVCSCGNLLINCDIWSKYKLSKSNIDHIEKYRHILNFLRDRNEKIIIDSSKNLWMIDVLRKLRDNGDINLKILFLARDARGWAASRKDLGRGVNAINRPYIYYFYLWYKQNKNILKFLKDNNLSYKIVSYERIAFETEKALKDIFSFLEISYDGFDLSKKANSHIAYGNRTKKNKNNKLIYDSRWITRYWLNIQFILAPNIFKWNNNLIYKSKKYE